MPTETPLPPPAQRRRMLLEAFADGKEHTPRELAERFGWAEPTTRKDLLPLVKSGELEQVPAPAGDPGGPIRGYRLPRNPWETTPTHVLVGAAADAVLGPDAGRSTARTEAGGDPTGRVTPGGNVSTPQAAPSGNASAPALFLEEVPVELLVYDRALQCRVSLRDETIEEYAEKFRAGATFGYGRGQFPPIRIVRVDGKLLVVDGWHRGHAADSAELEFVLAEITDGTRRDALLEAVKANGAHGLKRSNDDKSRAVRVLLQDAEWAALSNRDLADLADVSHAFVGNVRTHYGLERGQVLTDERIEEIDGELPPAWAELLEDTYRKDEVRSLRLAKTLTQIDKIGGGSYDIGVQRAVILRLEELATDTWPWPADLTPEKMEAHAAKLDDIDQLEMALHARDCPDRKGLWDAWRTARRLPRLKETWDLRNARDKVKGRKALLAAIDARLKDLEAAEQERRGADPWEIARRLLDAVDKGKLEALAEAPAEHLGHVEKFSSERLKNLPDEVLQILRTRLEQHRGKLVPCADPLCRGWLESGSKKSDAWCVLCRRDHKRAQADVQRVLELATRLLEGGWVALTAGTKANPITIDKSAVELLASLAAAAAISRTFDEWLADGPIIVREAFDSWRRASS
jgi:hypothetical protein